MPIDTLLAYVGVYDSVADAEADYQLIKDLHRDAGLIDAYDAAVVERREAGKTKIVKKHETPTQRGRCSGWRSRARDRSDRGAVSVRGRRWGLLAGTAVGGAILSAVAGQAAAGMSATTSRNSQAVTQAPSPNPTRWRGAPRSRSATDAVVSGDVDEAPVWTGRPGVLLRPARGGSAVAGRRGASPRQGSA
jgi:uncharacterized membrane protein